MNEVRTRNVNAHKNPDGTWHVVWTQANGNVVMCRDASEAMMRQAVDVGARQQPEPEAGNALGWLLAPLCSPTVLTALCVSLFLYGRC